MILSLTTFLSPFVGKKGENFRERQHAAKDFSSSSLSAKDRRIVPESEEERERKKEREKDEDDLMLESDAPRGKRSERADRDENEEEVGAGTTNEKNNGKMSAVKKSNDLLDANALEHLVGACERACASPSIRTPDGAASTSSSSFDERRQRQRERTKEFCSRLKPHVARITAKEVGLAAEEEEEPKSFFTSLLKRVKKKYSRTFSSRSVYSQTVYGCENFQISTFIIPKGMEIPLHNHPAMTVFSKCLYGSAKVQTYKWKDGNYENARAHKPRACELVSDVVITALDDDVQVCSPEENIHRVVAITDLAILDVFVPPYDAGGERGCTYYELNREQKESFTLLEIVDSPFKCYPMEYKGLKI
tara:strand:+ start:1594 stop:2679 length:1086 start_codon:yes stop_codon:yes gene_type:complete